MGKLIEKFETGTKERERLEYEWQVLQEMGNSLRIEAAAEEIETARQKGYFPLSGERGGRYLITAGDFIVGGAANCSYLLYQAGVTKVDALKYDLPFERFLNPLKKSEAELSLVPRLRRTVEPTEENLLRLLIEKGVRSERILCPKEIVTAEGEAQPVKDILAPTNGYLVYQEQLLHLLHRVGGYSYAEADLLRRELSKNRPVSFEKFSEGALALGYREKDVRALEKYIYEEIASLYPKAHLLALALG